MAISFYCPLGDAISFPDERAGQRELCPVCGVPVIVPKVDAPTTRPASEPSLAHPPLAPAVPPPLNAALLPIPTAAPPMPPPPPPPRAAVVPPERLWAAPSSPPQSQHFDTPISELIGELPPIRQRGPSRRHLSVGDLVVADPSLVSAARSLAVALGVVAMVSMAPSLLHPNLATAPNWARLGLLIGGVQLAYVVWMACLPDWSTVWLAMVAFALAGALYAVAMAAAALTPVDQAVPFELTDVRRVARLWCGIVVLLSGLMCFFAGRLSYRWRRAAAPRR